MGNKNYTIGKRDVQIKQNIFHELLLMQVIWYKLKTTIFKKNLTTEAPKKHFITVFNSFILRKRH